MYVHGLCQSDHALVAFICCIGRKEILSESSAWHVLTRNLLCDHCLWKPHKNVLCEEEVMFAEFSFGAIIREPAVSEFLLQ